MHSPIEATADAGRRVPRWIGLAVVGLGLYLLLAVADAVEYNAQWWHAAAVLLIPAAILGYAVARARADRGLPAFWPVLGVGLVTSTLAMLVCAYGIASRRSNLPRDYNTRLGWGTGRFWSEFDPELRFALLSVALWWLAVVVGARAGRLGRRWIGVLPLALGLGADALLSFVVAGAAEGEGRRAAGFFLAAMAVVGFAVALWQALRQRPVVPMLAVGLVVFAVRLLEWAVGLTTGATGLSVDPQDRLHYGGRYTSWYEFGPDLGQILLGGALWCLAVGVGTWLGRRRRPAMAADSGPIPRLLSGTEHRRQYSEGSNDGAGYAFIS